MFRALAVRAQTSAGSWYRPDRETRPFGSRATFSILGRPRLLFNFAVLLAMFSPRPSFSFPSKYALNLIHAGRRAPAPLVIIDDPMNCRFPFLAV
jgi:hypothetical protein